MPKVNDILSALPQLRWRGEAYPVSGRSMSYRHEVIEHFLQYRAGDFPEPVAPHGMLFRYTIPARDGISKGGYGLAFTQKLRQMFQAMRDKRIGDLIDPVYGKLRAVPISYTDDLDVLKRDGVDLTIELLEASELDVDADFFTEGLLSMQEVVRDTGAIDEEVRAAQWEQEPSPEPNTDILSLINGVPAQALAQAGRLTAAAHDLAYRLEKIEQTADRVENPQNWGLRDAARRVRLATTKLAARAAQPPSRKLRAITVNYNRALGDVAEEVATTQEELVELNPRLARSPVVLKNTVVIVPG